MAEYTVWRRLRGTKWVFTVELNREEYQHFKLAERQKPDVSMPMDINVMREVAILVEATEPAFERPVRAALIVEDEAQDAAETVGG